VLLINLYLLPKFWTSIELLSVHSLTAPALGTLAVILKTTQRFKKTVSILDKITNLFGGNEFKNVRIEKIKPFETAYEVNTDTVWFENHNINDCIRATEKLKIEHIHLQTNTVDFLTDPRLKNIKGITIQFVIQNIEPLFCLKHLTHLGLPDDIKIEFDFSKFENLIFLGGSIPKKYVNLEKLSHLKYTYLFGYRKSDFKEFSYCIELTKLWMYSVDIENLNGLETLANLKQLDLENCRKLVSLDGIGIGNTNLQTVNLTNCKKLRNADALMNLPNLKQLSFYQINELDSLSFLNGINKLEMLRLHPSKVGVQNKDYYPLIETLKKINKLDNLKGWKPLKEYLNNKVIIEPIISTKKSELQLIRENLGIMSWTEKKEDGLEQYSKKNCKKAETIIIDLINHLEKVAENDFDLKEELIKQSVLKLNKLNDSLDGSFIETGEREELCDLFDNIADAVGLNVQDYQDGIASKWREW